MLCSERWKVTESKVDKMGFVTTVTATTSHDDGSTVRSVLREDGSMVTTTVSADGVVSMAYEAGRTATNPADGTTTTLMAGGKMAKKMSANGTVLETTMLNPDGSMTTTKLVMLGAMKNIPGTVKTTISADGQTVTTVAALCLLNGIYYGEQAVGTFHRMAEKRMKGSFTNLAALSPTFADKQNGMMGSADASALKRS